MSVDNNERDAKTKNDRDDMKYLIWPGNDQKTFANALRRTSDFQGICYACGVLYHSQSFCPLRFCRRCKQYGHTSRVCPLINDNPPSRYYDYNRK